MSGEPSPAALEWLQMERIEVPVAEPTPGANATLRVSREDPRLKMPEPPPVCLVSVRDVCLPVVAGLETALDAFYRDLLGLERVEASADIGRGPIYRAENHDLCFDVIEKPPERQGCRPLGIVTPFFARIVEQFEEMKLDYEPVHGLVAGEDGILLQDPTGNWIALAPLREFR